MSFILTPKQWRFVFYLGAAANILVACADAALGFWVIEPVMFLDVAFLLIVSVVCLVAGHRIRH